MAKRPQKDNEIGLFHPGENAVDVIEPSLISIFTSSEAIISSEVQISLGSYDHDSFAKYGSA